MNMNLADFTETPKTKETTLYSCSSSLPSSKGEFFCPVFRESLWLEVGAMPGKIIQCLKKVQISNPLVPIDKVGGQGQKGRLSGFSNQKTTVRIQTCPTHKCLLQTTMLCLRTCRLHRMAFYTRCAYIGMES